MREHRADHSRSLHEAVEAYADAIAILRRSGAKRQEARVTDALAHAVSAQGRYEDAIALALGSAVPIFVAQSVMLSSGVPRDQIERDEHEQRMGARKKGNPISL